MDTTVKIHEKKFGKKIIEIISFFSYLKSENSAQAHPQKLTIEK
jgi:hypothetical protein